MQIFRQCHSWLQERQRDFRVKPAGLVVFHRYIGKTSGTTQVLLSAEARSIGSRFGPWGVGFSGRNNPPSETSRAPRINHLLGIISTRKHPYRPITHTPVGLTHSLHSFTPIPPCPAWAPDVPHQAWKPKPA